MRQTRTIIIAGAGIAGLTAALAVAARNFRVIVLERAPELTEVGAGLQITPNAGHVLARFGLEHEVAGIATEPRAIDVLSGRNGGRIASIPLGEPFRQRFGLPYRLVHRADLLAILAAAAREQGEIELKTATPLVEFAAHSNGVSVMSECGGEEAEYRGAALIAADGVRSMVRTAMPGGKPAKSIGRTAWRATIPAAAAPDGLPTDRSGLWLGPDAHLVHYPMRRGAEINIVAIMKDDWSGEGWSHPGDPAWIAGRFRRWPDLARAVIAAPAEWLKWRIDMVDPREPWVAGPVALIGDAAHAMPPFLAQGAAMAIEDAAVLAAELDAHPDDTETALLRYQQRRRGRVVKAWRAAISNGDLYHMGAVTGLVRDLGMKAMGGPGLLRRYDWLYGWKPD